MVFLGSAYYRFRDTWRVDAPADRVFATLVDLAGYPAWWPDVRAVSKVDEDTAELTCRATLPYVLVVRFTRAEQDRAAGRLRVGLTGDLEGHLGCVLTSLPGGTRLDIAQHVVLRKALLRRLSPVARPVFRANHALMMRRGRHGLRARLT